MAQVIEMASPPSHHLDQPPTGVVVLVMRLEMLHQLVDPGGEDGYLDLW